MKKILIGIEDCIPGMQIAETVFNNYGAVIVTEDTILDEYIISSIRNLGIMRIKIYDSSDHMIAANSSKMFKAQYMENTAAVREILRDISSGNAINSNKVNEISNSIMDRINENRNIVDCINQIRSVDEYIYTHGINVSMLSMLMAKWLKFNPAEVKSIIYAGILHDIGKVKIPLDILNKHGSLTNAEYEEIKKHPVIGYNLGKEIPGINEDILQGILLHHEREDGTGYPLGLKDGQIHKFAKIIAVADIYDATTSNKSYRGRECPFNVFKIMENEYFGVLDHKIVNTLLKNIANYYIGDYVSLDTGDIGEIVYINQNQISKPIIRVNDKYIDLSVEKEIKILEIIQP